MKLAMKNDTQHFRLTLIAFILVMSLFFQFWELSNATLTLPVNFRHDVYRWKCLLSKKGGKRPYGDTREAFKNPCFNLKKEKCLQRKNNNSENSIAFFDTYHRYNNKSICNITLKNSEELLDDRRDCEHARGGTCIKNDPCVPCSVKFRSSFGNRWKRCQSCTRNNGNCNFIEGVGPYCFKSATDRRSVPCTKCCTESEPLANDNC